VPTALSCPAPHLDEAAQVAQPADGRAVRAGEELEEELALILRELAHHLPQPLNHAVLCGRARGSSAELSSEGRRICTGKLSQHLQLQPVAAAWAGILVLVGRPQAGWKCLRAELRWLTW